MFKMGLDLGLDIAFDTHALPKVQEILAAIEGLRPGEITPSLQGIEARARARLAVHGGDRDLAESMFKSAAAVFRELGMPLWVATTLAEHAEWLRQEGRSQQADQKDDPSRRTRSARKRLRSSSGSKPSRGCGE